LSVNLHKVFVGSVDKAAYVVGWSTEQSVTYGARSARVEFTPEVSVDIPNTVEIQGYHEGSWYTVFKGIVVRKALTLAENRLAVDCLDYTYYLFHRQVYGKSYQDKTTKEMIQDLISTYYTDITTTNVYAYTTRRDKIFDKLSVFEALRQLGTLENEADFWVNASKDLYFKPQSEEAAASVTLTEGMNVLEASKRVEDSKLANYVKVVGNIAKMPQNGDRWTEGVASEWGGSPAPTDETNRVKVGSYSLLINPQIGSDGVWYPSGKNWARDLQGFNKIHLWVWRLSPSFSEYLRIRFYTSAGNYHTYTSPALPDNAWTELDVPFSSFSAVGSPSWSNINWLEFQDGSATMHFYGPIDELYLYGPQIVKEASDATSQSTYRRRDITITDNTIYDPQFAQNYATAYKDAYKNPYTLLGLRCIFLPGQVEAGQKATVNIPTLGINSQTYRVLSCCHTVPSLETELELCTVTPLSLEEALARSRREIEDLLRRTV